MAPSLPRAFASLPPSCSLLWEKGTGLSLRPKEIDSRYKTPKWCPRQTSPGEPGPPLILHRFVGQRIISTERPNIVSNWQLTPVFLPGESHGQRSLTCCRELDMTEETKHASLSGKYGVWSQRNLDLSPSCITCCVTLKT